MFCSAFRLYQKCNTATVKGIWNSFVLDDESYYIRVLREEKKRQEHFVDKKFK